MNQGRRSPLGAKMGRTFLIYPEDSGQLPAVTSLMASSSTQPCVSGHTTQTHHTHGLAEAPWLS